MAETFDIGRFFFFRLSLKEEAPRYHVYSVYQTYPPYAASRTVFLRLWKRHSIALGWWEDNPFAETEDEVELMLRALRGGRGINYDPSEGGEGARVSNLRTDPA
jgi:hypothetical protein